MDFEPWWLIFIPVVFALGWIAARVDIRHMLSETRSLPKSYFKGLNFLLNEEPDHAIDAFVEVAKLDPETTELHFALGNLFRRRGEIERAIRVHQSLLSRADLPPTEREHALHELGHDFLKAGLLDRAEQAFEQLQDTRFAVPSVKALIRIYESEHDWLRAIEAVKRLHALVDEPVPQLAHYQCERAQAALSVEPADLATATEALDAANHAAQALRRQDADAQGAQARIAILTALQAKLAGDADTERLHLESLLELAPVYVGLVAENLLASYTRAGQAALGLQRLRDHYTRYPSLDVFHVILHALHAQEGAEAAWTFAREALRRDPSLLGLDRVLAVALNDQEAASQTTAPALAAPHADLSLLRSLIRRHTQLLDRYSCRQCGFQARHFYWQCPGCHAWETYAPRRLEEQR